MGVKDLWAILDPTAEDISLSSLYGKRVAIDLSAWICDSQAVGQVHRNIQRPDLRNTFFRASRLVLSNIVPIFVLEGEAPELKHATIRQRNATQRPQSQQSQDPGKLRKPRSQFQSRLKPMLRLLDAMGLLYIQSNGEAEKLCAILNKEEVVDAVISQDSDCLLYGAKDVLRHFSIAKGSANARKYSMTKVKEAMGFGREQLIVLSLLLGCDYCPGGVPGIGREQAVTYLKGLKGCPLKRIRSWQSDSQLCQMETERVQMSQPRSCSECWHPGTAHKHSTKGCTHCFTSKGCTLKTSLLKNGDEHSKWQLLELQIRNRALQIPNFPSEDIIQEFLDDGMVWEPVQIQWKQPNAKLLLDISTKLLGWEHSDSVEKVLQLISRWQCQHIAVKPLKSPPLIPDNLLKLRVQQGVRCIEVKWTANSRCSLDAADIASLTTLEPLIVFSRAYPELYGYFEKAKLAAKKTTKKATTLAKPRQQKIKICTVCGHESKTATSSKNGHICQFLKKTAKADHATPYSLEETMVELDFDESLPEHELSDILSSIINRQPKLPQKRAETITQDMSVEICSPVKTVNQPTKILSYASYQSDNCSLNHIATVEQINPTNLETCPAVTLTSQIFDRSIDDKENFAVDSDQQPSNINHLRTYDLAESEEINTSYINHYEFENASYRDDKTMPTQSTPINLKSKRESIGNFHCKFSLGLNSILDFDMSTTE